MNIKKLFSLANEIYNCREDIDEIKKIVKELIKYTKFHFSNEENYMKSINYLGLKDHKRLHEKIIKELATIVSKLDSLDIKEIKQKSRSVYH